MAWLYLDNAARMERQRRTVRPKKTTALRRTQTVCIVELLWSGSELLRIIIWIAAAQRPGLPLYVECCDAVVFEEAWLRENFSSAELI